MVLRAVINPWQPDPCRRCPWSAVAEWEESRPWHSPPTPPPAPPQPPHWPTGQPPAAAPAFAAQPITPAVPRFQGVPSHAAAKTTISWKSWNLPLLWPSPAGMLPGFKHCGPRLQTWVAIAKNPAPEGRSRIPRPSRHHRGDHCRGCGAMMPLRRWDDESSRNPDHN